MASNIDPTVPADGVPANKADLRNNLQAAKTEIEALQDGKADVDHSHALNDLTDVAVAGAGNGDFLRFNGANWAPSTSSGAGGDADGVDYQPLGTGANTRSVESYLRDNAVLATDFGVVDSATVNSTAALQRCFDAVANGQTRSRVIVLPKQILLRSANPDVAWIDRFITLIRDTSDIVIQGAPTTIWVDREKDGLSAIKTLNCDRITVKDVGVKATAAVARSASNPGRLAPCLVRFQGPGEGFLLENCWAEGTQQLAMFTSGGRDEGNGDWSGPQRGFAPFNPLRQVKMVNCQSLNTEHVVYTAGVEDIDIGNLYVHGRRSSGGAGIQRALWLGSYLRDLRGHMFLRECQPGTTAGVANISTDIFNNIDVDGIDLSVDARDIEAYNGVRFRQVRLEDPNGLPSGATLTSRIANVTLRGIITGCSRPVSLDFDFTDGNVANDSNFNPPIMENLNFEDLTLISSIRNNSRAVGFSGEVELRADDVRAQIRNLRFSNCYIENDNTSRSEAVFLHYVDGDILISDCIFKSRRSDNEGVLTIRNPRPTARLVMERTRLINENGGNGGVQVIDGNGMDAILDTVFIDTPRGYNSSSSLPNSSGVSVYRVGVGKDRSRVYSSNTW